MGTRRKKAGGAGKRPAKTNIQELWCRSALAYHPHIFDSAGYWRCTLCVVKKR